ncbi:MAG: hypothetical protein QM784_27370 [Polyangiaceae bacterium]
MTTTSQRKKRPFAPRRRDARGPHEGTTANAPGNPSAEASASATPNAIACGKARCKLDSEYCCVTERPYCVPRKRAEEIPPFCAPKPEDAATGSGFLVACDEPSDCPSGKRCCLDVRAEGDSEWRAGHCATTCTTSVLCQRDGQCGAAYVCDRTKGYGACAVARPGVADCQGQRCSGATPVCCMNSETGRASCTTEQQCPIALAMNDPLKPFVCRTQADCGSGLLECCIYPGTYGLCEPSCPYNLGINGGFEACASDEDCAIRKRPPEGFEFTGCRSDAQGQDPKLAICTLNAKQ